MLMSYDVDTRHFTYKDYENIISIFYYILIISMDTRLIYVDKKSAEVKNDKDGSFTNAISEGIVVKQGDSISLEGIAINSISVGADVIEVPQSVKGYEYKTNSQVLNCFFYIHHQLSIYSFSPFE